MNLEAVQELYQSKGFFWNEEIAKFASSYNSKEISYSDGSTGRVSMVRLFPPNPKFRNRDYPTYGMMAAYLGEEVAPVGDCDGRNIQLILTKSGKLIGFADYLLLRWGESEMNWQQSLALLLQGIEPTQIGLIDT